MFGEEQLKLMKPNAIVLNTARGKVLDERALRARSTRAALRGAAIDAFEEEPLPMDSPLRKLGDRVLLSPHSASFTEGGELRQGVDWATALGASPRSKVAFPTMSTTGTSFRAGRNASAAPA